VTDRETIIRINEERRDRLSERESRIVGLTAICVALAMAMIFNWLVDAQ
jgi:hypothetical protein